MKPILVTVVALVISSNLFAALYDLAPDSKFTSIYSDREQMVFEPGEKGTFWIKKKIEVQAPEMELVLVGMFPYRSNIVELKQFGEMYYFKTPELNEDNLDFVIQMRLIPSETLNVLKHQQIDNAGVLHKDAIFNNAIFENSEMIEEIKIDLTVNLPIVEKVIRLEGNIFHTCALFESHRLKCWGGNDSGQLGLGDLENRGDDETLVNLPFVELDGAVVDFSVGLHHTCALLDGNNVRCWGSNESGELGLETNENVMLPLSVEPLYFDTPIISITSGVSHNCLLFADGGMKCWGNNEAGQLGLGHTNNYGDDDGESISDLDYLPIGENVIEVTAHDYMTCALTETGNMKCWGYNYFGQLGLGHTEHIGDSEPIDDLDFVNFGDGILVKKVIAGLYHTCAILENDDLKCWGLNKDGQLGLGHAQDMGGNEQPFEIDAVSVGSMITEIDLGSRITCITNEIGQLKCWGAGAFGRLGTGDTDNIGDDRLPSDVGFIDLEEPVVTFVSGGSHVCALLESGKVKCFGSNNIGQLGLGHTDNMGDDEPVSEIPFLNFGGRKFSLLRREV